MVVVNLSVFYMVINILYLFTYYFTVIIIIFAVSVKWQKELLKDVEIDTSQPPYVFKCQLYDLTGVPPERQKIMVKGGLLKVRLFVVLLISKQIQNMLN